jgi:hypothetical protein
VLGVARRERQEELMKTRKSVLTVGLAIAATLAVTACGSGSGSGSTTTQSAPPTSAQTTTSTAASTPPATTTASSSQDSGLSGKWSGQYSGTYSGTFTLDWQQSGSKLSGTIVLKPGGTQSVNGTVDGTSIKFGTVGGPGITYTGSVSGSSMSGSYQTPNGGGSWSAHTTS